MSGLTDARGDEVTGANPKSLGLFEQALEQAQCYVGDPLATVGLAIKASPSFVMGHCLRAYLYLTATEAAAIPEAAASLKVAAALPANARERLHLQAISDLVEGDWERGQDRLEAVLLDHPRDVVALQVGHLFDFYRGDARSLRDRVARVLQAWSPGVPGFHGVLGMYAFGLEECGSYARAEELGRRALSLQPGDTWAHHAVTHVMEMQGRREEGVRWMESRQEAWARDSFFSVHNFWHWALFLLDLERQEEVLALYDGPIRGSRSKVVLDMIDASAILWRVHLRGIDLGARWGELAEAWAPHTGDGFYAFNDAHAMMAFVGAGRWDLAGELLKAMEGRLTRGGSNEAMTREVGLPLSRALHAFGQGRHEESLEILSRVRLIANRFGGSHAQRDLIDLTLMEAAARGSRRNLVRALASERAELKPPAAITLRYRMQAA